MDAYRAECAEIEAVWQREIASADGPLPGSRLTALVTPQGWCGQLVPADGGWAVRVLSASKVIVAALATAYHLPESAITMRPNGERAVFVWAYRTAGGADYHRAWPHPPLDGSEYVDIQREKPGTSLLDLVQLTTRARAYQESWTALRTGRAVDMGQVVRRYQRLRAGVHDLLPHTPADQIRDILLQVGVNREALPDDLAATIGYPAGSELTVPFPRS
ncbi:hypothetical protein [Actinophytocola sediminis]